MANTVSAKKRIRQNTTRRSLNRWRLKAMRTEIKTVRDHLFHGHVAEAETALPKACRVIDKTAGKGVIHKNTAARYKSRLVASIQKKKTDAA